MLDRLISPPLPPVPNEAMDLITDLYMAHSESFQVAVAGASLGGFYATCLAERFGCRAVLINPAVRPHLLLTRYIGENINYNTSERWRLDDQHIEQLRLLDVEAITRPERYFLMLQKADEKLDYRQADEKYRGCRCLLEEGGNHSFAGFENHIADLLAFCSISAD